LALRERLACLVRNDVRQVVPVLPDELIPLEQALSASSGVYFLEVLECLVGALDGRIGVLGRAVWRRGPDFAVAWVVDVEALAALRLDPLAAYKSFVAEEVRIVELDIAYCQPSQSCLSGPSRGAYISSHLEWKVGCHCAGLCSFGRLMSCLSLLRGSGQIGNEMIFT